MAEKPGAVAQFVQYLKGFSLLRNSAQPTGAVEAGDEENNGVAPLPTRRKPGGWRTMPYIIGNETFERVASFGLTTNLTIYLVKVFHLKQVDAVTLTQIWNGTTSFVPVLGAYLADAYWGRFKTLAWACVATFLGMVVMTLTAAIRGLKPPSCGLQDVQLGRCEQASRSQMGVLIVALGLLTLGAAGVRPCNLPFGMDQFDRSTESGRKGTGSYFNWYYTTNTLAVVIAMTLIVYLQDSVSWAVGFGVSALLMLLAIALFLLGSRIYVYFPPEGSILSGIAQVLVAAFKKRSLSQQLPSHSHQKASLCKNNDNTIIIHDDPATMATNTTNVVQLPLTQQFSFLNKAAIKLDGEVDPDSGALLKPWSLCTVQRIEEVKCLIRVIPIWVSGITCMVAIAQQFTYAVLQSLTMDRHLGPHFEIPPASIAVISLIAMVLFLPVYDRAIVPIFRRWRIGRRRKLATTVEGEEDHQHQHHGMEEEGGITLLQRMGVGIAISAASMVVAGVVERKRRNMALAHGGGGFMAPMSALWLVPQLALVGISEAFNAVGQIEFYNQQFPDQMRSLATSLFSCSIAGANYLSSIVVTLVHEHTHHPNWLDNNINVGRLDYFYYLLGVVGGLDLLYFLIVSQFYHYKGVTPRGDQYDQQDKLSTQDGGEELVAITSNKMANGGGKANPPAVVC